ncbi:hypothetical protein ACFL1R_02590 [Candidatus Latescibacterota bacterium]
MKKSSVVYIIIVCVMVFSLAGTVSAGNNTISYRNAKTIGMGDARIAGGFTYNGFVDNPALLSRVKIIRFSVVNLPITFNENVLDMGKFIDDNTDKFENFNELSTDEKNAFIEDMQEYDGKWGRANVSPMIDIAANILGYGMGLAIFNTNDIGLKIDRGIYEPRVWGEGSANYAVVLGVAKPVFMFYPGLTVGVNLKYIQRRRANLFQIPASDLGDISETSGSITDEFKETKRNTFAMDIGALLDIPFIDTEVGATVQSIGDGRGSSIDVGIAKRMLSERLLLLADYIDLLDNNRENIFNKLHLGAEFKYLFFALRGGINSGYPVLGIGLDFKVFDIDVAYFREELGNAPGLYDDQRYIGQIKFGW